MKYESDLINVALTQKNISQILSNIDINSVSTKYIKDILLYIKEHVDNYETFPTPTVVQEEFPDYKYNPTSEDLRYYIDKYKEQSAKKKLTNIIENSLHQASEKPYKALEYLKNGVGEIYKIFGASKEVTLDVAVGDMIEHYINNPDDVHRGIPTGLPKVDSKSMPLMGGELNIIFARSGVGKSWLALHMMLKAWRKGYNTLFISLELNERDVAARLTSLATHVNKNQIKKGMHKEDGLKDQDRIKVLDFEKQIKQQKNKCVIEYRYSCTTYDIEALIERHGPDIVFIDYLGLMDSHKKYSTGNEMKMKEKMRDISKELKHMAAKYNLPVVAVHQSNRDFDDKKDELPKLKNLADSDDIGRNADKVFALHQNEEMKNRDEMVVGTVKVRDAKSAQVVCRWDLDHGDIEELSYFNNNNVTAPNTTIEVSDDAMPF